MRPNATFEVDLTEEQVASYRENGFLSIERITTDEEIEWLKEIYDQLFEQRAGEDKGMYFDLAAPRGHSGREVLPQVLGPDLKIPELRESNYFQNARKLGTQLLGVDEKVIAGGHMIFKPAQYGAETPWHQDEAYWWNPDAYLNRLSVWMPLDAATVESGCMQFIPGSHKEEVRWHRHIDNNPLIHGLLTDDVDSSEAVALCALAGGRNLSPPPNAALHRPKYHGQSSSGLHSCVFRSDKEARQTCVPPVANRRAGLVSLA